MSDESLPKEELLRKILNMTTSDNDGQALVAIRKANALLSAAGWTWDKLLAGKIKIVESPFKNMPNPSQPAQVKEPAPQRAAPTPRSFSRAPMPSHSPGVGKVWQYDRFYDSWTPVADPSYRAPPPPPRPTAKPGLGLSRKNLYAGHCYCCGDHVPNEAGYILKPSDFNTSAKDKWFICCAPCNSSRSTYSIPASPAMKNTGQTTVRAPAPGLGEL